MPVLNEAEDLKMGTTQVEKVYFDLEEVWPQIIPPNENPPTVPTSVVCVSTSTDGQLSMTWSPPTPVDPDDPELVTGYNVEASDGTWKTVSSTQPAKYTWTDDGSGGTRTMRVQAYNSFGESAWVTKTVTPEWDTTPPGAPNITSWKPEASYGQLKVRFTTSSSDNYQYRVLTNTNGGSYTTRKNWTSVGNNQSVTVTALTGSSGNSYRVRVDVRDSKLNTRTGTNTPYYTLQTSPKLVYASQVGHWRNGVWGGNSGDPWRPYQGYFSNPSYNYRGIFAYGTNAIKNACQNAASSTYSGALPVIGMTVVFVRQGGGVNQADCVYAGGTGISVIPAAGTGDAAGPGVYDGACVGTLVYNQSGEFWLPTNVWTYLVTGSYQGVGLYSASGKPYMSLFRLDENSLQGLLRIYHYG